MPVYKDENKKKNKYWYEFEAGKDLLTGKRNKIRKKGFYSEKEAKAAMVKAMNEFFEGNYIDPSQIKLYEYMTNTWLSIKKISDQTRVMYTSYIKTHIKNSLIGNEKISNLSVTDIQNFIILLEKKELEPNTIKKIYNILNASLNDAVTMKILKENPAKSIINKPKEVKSEINVWSRDEAIKFIDEIEGKSRYSIVFRIALATGMRQGEILGLRWKDVDFSNNLIRVTQTISHDGKKLKSGAKTKGSVRPVKIDEKTKYVLIKQYNMIQNEKLAARKTGKNYQEYDLVICTNRGTTCSPRNLMRVFYSLLKNVDVPKITFHAIRHTVATLLLEDNVKPKIISEMFGHSTTRLVNDLYSHLTPNMQNEAAISLGKLFK